MPTCLVAADSLVLLNRGDHNAQNVPYARQDFSFWKVGLSTSRERQFLKSGAENLLLACPHGIARLRTSGMIWVIPIPTYFTSNRE